jgi:uncharacterized OsmC-like protein
MTIRVTRVSGTKLKAEIDGFEIVSGQVDEHTEPEGPTPGRLMVASLGLCAGLYVAWYLKRHGISDEGLTVDVDATDEMNPSRAAGFDVVVNLKAELSEKDQKGLMSSVSHCYVGNTLKGNAVINYSLNLTRT